jgi:hypothetical protein
VQVSTKPTTDEAYLTLATVRALDARVIPRLGTLAGFVAHWKGQHGVHARISPTLIAVATLEHGRVRLVRAVLGAVSLLPAVAAGLSWLVGALLGKVTFLVAMATFHILGRARLGALAGFVTGLSTVAAGHTVLARLRAVTDAMARLITVHALDFDAVGTLTQLLRARLGDMPEFSTVSLHKSRRMLLTLTVAALRDLAINRDTRVLETSHVLFRRFWPALLHLGTLGLVAEEEPDGVLAVEVAL